MSVLRQQREQVRRGRARTSEGRSRPRAGALAGAALVLGMLGGALGAQAPAGATTAAKLYASSTGSGTTCTMTSRCTLSEAVTKAEVTTGPVVVTVAAGTYTTQVVVGQSSKMTSLTIHGPTVTPPSAVLQPTSLLCTTTDPLDSRVPPVASVVSVVETGADVSVSVSHLKIDGASVTDFHTCKKTGATATPDFWGVAYQAASGTVSDLEVTGITPDPATPAKGGGNNVDSGIAVENLSGYTSTVSVSYDTVSTYQKDGIECFGNGATCTITHDTVTGAGFTDVGDDAQNGIQVSWGATGTVDHDMVSTHDYAGNTIATGVLVITSSTVTVTHNSLVDDQDAVAFQAWGTTASDVHMSGETISSNTISYTPAFHTAPYSAATYGSVAISASAFKFGTTTPDVTATISNNTVDGPGPYSTTTPMVTFARADVGIEVGQTSYSTSLYTAGPDSAVVSGNTVEGWTADVVAEGAKITGSSVTISRNDLLTAGFGVDNISGTAQSGTPPTTAIPVRAQDNWWGSTSGPGPVGLGIGTDVSADVTYAPWCTNAACSAPPTTPTPPATTPPATTPPAPPSTSTASASGSSSTPTGTTGNVTSSDATTQTTVVADATGAGAITVAQYTADPVTAKPFSTGAAAYFDVEESPGSNFTSLSSKVCSPSAGGALAWYDGTAWVPVVGDPGPTLAAGTPPCVSFTLTSTSSPSVSELTGTDFATGASGAPTVTGVQPGAGPAAGGTSVVLTGTGLSGASAVHFGTAEAESFSVTSATTLTAVSPPGSGTVEVTVTTPSGTSAATSGAAFTYSASASAGTGYRLVAADGRVFSFGSARYYGSEGGKSLAAPVVGMTAAPTGDGYWLVAADGGVFSFGSARYYGSEGGKSLAAPVVGMTAAPTGNGYWLVAADGGVFSFGSARYYGSEGGKSLAAPVVGMAAAPTGNGYWLVAADGGVFSFGSARFYGSEGGKSLAAPVVGMAAAPTGDGYWLVAADGGVFSFGSARFYGSEGGKSLAAPVVGIAAAPTGDGYWLVAADGGVFSFGSARFYGSEGGKSLAAPVVGMAST